MPAAIKEIDRAIELALPDRLYAPLADYRDNLGTLLDERLALTDKEALKAVKALSKQVSVGWAALNRELRGLINTTNLTQQEHHAAKLAVKGLTNAEIAERMHVSVNTIKRYISEAISKTGARDRSELVKYLAMEFLVE
ncbi:MAG: helix-turn-helix transcriptional regulator [Clostridia bacterium]|nr:helix-turn-helix transcriptional regulator [Clostridia bacterium]